MEQQQLQQQLHHQEQPRRRISNDPSLSSPSSLSTSSSFSSQSYSSTNKKKNILLILFMFLWPISILVFFRSHRSAEQILYGSSGQKQRNNERYFIFPEEKSKPISSIRRRNTNDDEDDYLYWQLSRYPITTSNNNNKKALSSLFSPTTVVTRSKSQEGKICKCELLSIDCLESIDCLSLDSDKEKQIVLGMELRKSMKSNLVKFSDRTLGHGYYPVGMAIQHSIIDAWNIWMESNTLPVGFEIMGHGSNEFYENDTFIDESLYPYCVQHNLNGKRCFFKDLNSMTHSTSSSSIDFEEDVDWIERQAIRQYNNGQQQVDRNILKQDINDFWEKSQISTSHIKDNKKKDNDKLVLPALGNILTFAHIARMRFHRQVPIIELYRQHYKQVIGKKSVGSTNNLRVALHIRRADACDHQSEGYQQHKTPLDSPAQVSGKRLCYATSVYIEELRRVQSIIHRQQPEQTIDVYLSTDYAGSVLDDIRSNYRDVYESMNWHYLQFDRNTFRYDGVIEDENNDPKQQKRLGETAVADLWHLSHGQVFIGHLGSRFGKLGWLLSIARHNAFVPYVTVDGHSFCCEVDENCGQVKPYITDMMNCMTFTHATSHFAGYKIPINEDYWEVGSTVRIALAEHQYNKKKTKKKKKHHSEEEEQQPTREEQEKRVGYINVTELMQLQKQEKHMTSKLSQAEQNNILGSVFASMNLAESKKRK